MPQIIVDLTAAQYFALELDIVDVEAWVLNAPQAKALSNIAALPEPIWRSIVSAAAVAGVDTADTDAVLIYARDNNLLQTAAQRVSESVAPGGSA